MTAPQGGFYSAQDADSDGEEGKFYTFTFGEILDVLGQDMGKQFASAYDITAEGNFEGKNIPNLLKNGAVPYDMNDAIQKLYDYRKHRTTLHTDDKILLSWNAMMIAALSMLYRVSGKHIYLHAAKTARDFLLKSLCDGTRRIAHGGKTFDLKQCFSTIMRTGLQD